MSARVCVCVCRNLCGSIKLFNDLTNKTFALFHAPSTAAPARLNMQFIAQLDDDDETTFTLAGAAAQSGEMRSSPKEIGAFNENGRNFVATKDTSRDFSNSQDNTDRGSMSDQAFACSASSVESLPSASGSSEYKTLSMCLDVCVCVCVCGCVYVCAYNLEF